MPESDTGETPNSSEYSGRFRQLSRELGDSLRVYGKNFMRYLGLAPDSEYSDDADVEAVLDEANDNTYRTIGSIAVDLTGLAANWTGEKLNELSYRTATNIRLGFTALATAINVWPANPSLIDDAKVAGTQFALGLCLEAIRTIKETKRYGFIEKPRRLISSLTGRRPYRNSPRWTLSFLELIDSIGDGYPKEDTDQSPGNDEFTELEKRLRAKTAAQVLGLPLGYIVVSQVFNCGARWEGIREAWDTQKPLMLGAGATALYLLYREANKAWKRHKDPRFDSDPTTR